jgi:hypothetical protein
MEGSSVGSLRVGRKYFSFEISKRPDVGAGGEDDVDHDLPALEQVVVETDGLAVLRDERDVGEIVNSPGSAEAMSIVTGMIAAAARLTLLPPRRRSIDPSHQVIRPFGSLRCRCALS